MTWIIDLPDLQELIADDLPLCARAMRALYRATAFPPEQWQADIGYGGPAKFWAIAVHQRRVLWYNHFEQGFNVSTVPRWGVIGEYWCNPDDLWMAVPRLAGRSSHRPRLGGPQPIPPFSWE